MHDHTLSYTAAIAGGLAAGIFLEKFCNYLLDRIARKRRRLRQIIEALERGEDPNISDPPSIL